jgi:hypothetical protein
MTLALIAAQNDTNLTDHQDKVYQRDGTGAEVNTIEITRQSFFLGSDGGRQHPNASVLSPIGSFDMQPLST